MRIQLPASAIVTSLLLLHFAASGCAGREPPAPDGPHPALDVVARYYAALDAPPDGLAGLGLDPAALAAARVANVTVELVEARDDYALVRARGALMTGAPGLQAPLCDLHDVRRGDDGRWAIDIDAPERARRLARIAARQEAEIAALLEAAAESDGVFGDKGRVLAIYANRCE